MGKISKLQKKGKLKFSLPNVNGQITATARKIEAFSDNDYMWSGVIENGQGDMTIRCEKGMTFGYIHYLNPIEETSEMYSLYSLKDSISVMIQKKQGKFGKCESEFIKPIVKLTEPTDSNKLEDRSVIPCNSTINGITVLILTSARARAAVSNINQAAQTAVDQYNSALINSLINSPAPRLVLTQVRNLEDIFPAFRATNRISEDLRSIRTNPDVIAARRAAIADIVVILTDDGYTVNLNILGIAADIDARIESAFAIVEVKTIEENQFIFTHEIGHIMGGQHQNDNSVNNFDGDALQPYAHAFIPPNRSWWNNFLLYGTVMHARPNPEVLEPKYRLNLFSNPNNAFIEYSIFGRPSLVPLGNSTTGNIARRIQETTPRISAYMPEANLNVSISGYSYISTYGTFNYDAVTSCGVDPFTWTWEVSQDGFNYYNITATNDLLSINYQPSSTKWYYLKVTVRDNQGSSDVDFMRINYFDDDTNPNIRSSDEKLDNLLKNVKIYPNPVQNIITADFEVHNSEAITFGLFDIQGRQLLSATENDLIRGRRLKTLDTKDLPNGLYILKITCGKSSIIEKITIQK